LDRSGDLDLERGPSPPGHGDRRGEEAGVEEQRVVGSSRKAHEDSIGGDVDLGVGVEEAAEDLPRLGVIEAVQMLPRRRYRPVAITVSVTSKSTFIATADDRAST
jgi:hypothetical protein